MATGSPDVTLIHGDCLEVMKTLEAGSVDCVITDPPYGMTSCEWDIAPDLPRLWHELKRVLKPLGAVVMTASQPFTTDLINSNRAWFKYEWIWVKSRPSDRFNVKNKPMKKHENVLVFSEGTTANRSPDQMPYNPQGLVAAEDAVSGKTGQRHHGTRPSHRESYRPEFTGYPTSILDYPSDAKPVHPTQKPVPLMSELIRTYSNEGDTILDPFAGSGSTGVACMKTGRRTILIESDPKYIPLIQRRLQAAETPLFAGLEGGP